MAIYKITGVEEAFRGFAVKAYRGNIRRNGKLIAKVVSIGEFLEDEYRFDFTISNQEKEKIEKEVMQFMESLAREVYDRQEILHRYGDLDRRDNGFLKPTIHSYPDYSKQRYIQFISQNYWKYFCDLLIKKLKDQKKYRKLNPNNNQNAWEIVTQRPDYNYMGYRKLYNYPKDWNKNDVEQDVLLHPHVRYIRAITLLEDSKEIVI